MNKKVISKIVEEIKLTEPIKLQVNGSKDNSPAPIGYSRSDKKFMPDIVAKFKNKRDIYAIEKDISDNDIHLLVSKWILFSAEARKYFGTFYIVIPSAQEEEFEKIIIEKQLEVKLILI
ncbi:hypothetical protein DNU06_13805 [Putridiphycobacter roseus]|uniref:Uncharacterized protein n=1 Tax=Putridiphycobacter roseus TaxID=2219161 RepID=A0A2W1NNM0_9FLAO|nr:hypothetical protein [Putridiphycobacter roseus]PZE16198.1 hypothetical protein DNU06_13805 [Putridiphycobacter roseus]